MRQVLQTGVQTQLMIKLYLQWAFVESNKNELMGKEAEVASKNKELMFKEMSYRELFLFPEQIKSNFLEGLTMFCSYIVGGSISLLAYFLFSIPQAIILSIVFALSGLFLLGVVTSRFTKLGWWKLGARMLFLGALSASVGYVIGQVANNFR